MEKSSLGSTNNAQTFVNRGAVGTPASLGSTRQTHAIASGAQEAPSLVDTGSNKLQRAQFKPQALEKVIRRLKDLIEKHSSDPSVRDQIFEILSGNRDLRATLDQEIESIRNTKKDLAQEDTDQIERLLKLKEDPHLGTMVIDHIYLIKDEETIRTLETLLQTIIDGSSDIDESSDEIFKLFGIFNKTSSLSTPILNYIFEYLDSVKHTGLISEDNRFGINLVKISLYFAYGLLSKNQDILGTLRSSMESQSTEVKDLLFMKIRLSFLVLMRSLRASDAKAYCTPGAYDGIILYACKSFPILVDHHYDAVLLYFGKKVSRQNMLNACILKNTQGECLLDSLYSKVDLATMTGPSVFDGPPFDCISVFEHCLYSQYVGANTIGVLDYLKLPHLLNYLANVPFESLTKEHKENYLLLSIALKNTELIQRFSKIRIDTEKMCTSLELILVSLFKNVFGIDEEGKSLDRSLVEKLFKGQVVPGSPRELFFKILSNLKDLNVLQSTTVMSIVLSDSLKYDLNYPHEASTFDYVLENLKRIGFDLHFIEPAYKGNLIFEAFDLGNVDLVVKFIALGLNPFRINDRDLSFLRIEHLLSAIRESAIEEVPNFAQAQKNFLKQWKARGLSVLKLVGLDQHEALKFYNQIPKFSPQAYLLKNNQAVCTTLSKKDSKGRSGLMVLVMCNQDIKLLLPYINPEHLLAKDDKGKTVVDYANDNNDKDTIVLLAKREKDLRKGGAFRKLAQVVSGSRSAVSSAKNNRSQRKKEEKRSKAVLAKEKLPQIEGRISAEEKNKKKEPVLINLEAQPQKTETPEINLYYDAQSGKMATETKAARKAAQEAIDRAEAKKKKKEKKAAVKGEVVQPSQGKEGWLNKTKQKMKGVVEALDTARKIATHPSELARSLAEKLQKKPNLIDRLQQSEKVLRLSKTNAPVMLEDGVWLGNFASLSDLANEALGKGLLSIPSSGIIKTLEAMDHAISIGKSTKINRLAILEAMQWALGGSIEGGHGSHINFRWQGGVFTIPQNKDGSDHADILYIKKAAVMITQGLRSLLLRNAATHSTLSSAQTSEGDESNLHKTSEASSIEEAKDETTEASESSAEDAS